MNSKGERFMTLLRKCLERSIKETAGEIKEGRR